MTRGGANDSTTKREDEATAAATTESRNIIGDVLLIANSCLGKDGQESDHNPQVP